MTITNQSTASMDETRRTILFELLQSRYKNDNVSRSYIDRQVEYYLSKMDDGAPALELRPQETMTDAIRINNEMMETEIDIHTIFSQLEHISNQSNQHQELNESVLNDVRVRVQKVEQKLQEVTKKIYDDSAHIVIYETFLDQQSKEPNIEWYRDRDGIGIGTAKHLTLDVYESALKLPTLYTENKLVNFAGVRMANIGVTKQIGGGLIRSQNPEHTIDKAIDTSLSTYWSESILSDEPLSVNLGVEYYGLQFGATCEIEIRFDYISRINELTFTPFTEFPMQIVAIHIFTTDNDDEKPFELVSPDTILTQKESIDIMSYQFQSVEAKRIRILLNQQHYVKQDILVDADNKTLVDAWLGSQGFTEPPTNAVFKSVYRDHADRYPHWMSMKQFMQNRDIVSEIQRYEDVDMNNKIHLSKYEYQYGLYNIAVNQNEYYTEGIHITKQLSESNVHLVTLDALEEHPILDEVKIPVTNIEYYISDAVDPSTNDWIPIMPQNVEDIHAELLYPYYEENQYRADARFPILKLHAVRRNGHILSISDDYTTSTQGIHFIKYDPNATYTIDYQPVYEARQIDFLERYTVTEWDEIKHVSYSYVKPPEMAEEFRVNDEPMSQFPLSRHPFIDKEKLNVQDYKWNPTYLSNTYLPLRVRIVLPDGDSIEQQADKWDSDNIYLVNKTDYFDSRKNLLEPFKGTNYQYAVVGNILKFNTKLPKGTKVYADYPFLTGPIRMKIVMRRTLEGVEGLTPFLHEYKIGLQTLS